MQVPGSSNPSPSAAQGCLAQCSPRCSEVRRLRPASGRPKRVSAGKESVPPYTLTFGLDTATDLAALDAVDPAAVDAAKAILDDLAHGRVIGKLPDR